MSILLEPHSVRNENSCEKDIGVGRWGEKGALGSGEWVIR